MTPYRERREAGEYDAPAGEVAEPEPEAEPEAEPEPEPEAEPEPEPEEEPAYAEMTKAELLELAQERGVSPANNAMTKDELIEGLLAAV